MRGKKAKWMLAGAVFALAMVFSGGAQAQEGFYVGTGIGFAMPQWSGDMDDSDPETGLGLELIHLGYNFTPNWGVGLQWGSIAGELSGEIYDYDIDEGTYGEGYFTLSGRYTFNEGVVPIPLTPYIEFGLGQYSGLGEVEIDNGPDVDITIDPATGVRLAVGGLYYIDKFYVAPELSYHMVEFDDVEYDIDGFGDVDDDDIGNGDFLMLLVKIGYHFNK